MKINKTNVRKIVWLSGSAGVYSLHIDTSRVVGSELCEVWGSLEVTDYKAGCEMVRRIRGALLGLPLKTEQD